RWASRITLEITGVKVERVQDISSVDCHSEGIDPLHWMRDALPACVEFRDLWDSINAKRGYGWDANPWNFALTFKVVS
ncbi:hypothetical protein LCGC14_2206280, partial [marine sediment metagenome]